MSANNGRQPLPLWGVRDGADGVATELVAKGRVHPHRERVLLPAREPREQRRREHVHVDAALNPFDHGPAPFARIVDVAAKGVEVRVETRSGDVTGSDLTAAGVTVQTASGDVQLRLSSAGGQVTVSTASGDVQVRLSGAPEGVTVSTASGDVSITLPQPTGGDGYLVTTQTASGDVDAIASDGRRPVTVTTASGDISVQY